jgi:CYTH domain-containing protein
MALEIERRFTLKPGVNPQDLNVVEVRNIIQSYLSETGSWAIRVRKTESENDTFYTLTMKKKVSSDTCVELEVPITLERYQDIFENCSYHLSKTRYVVEENGTWDIDEYHHEGLEHNMIAEIEFDQGNEIKIPDWVDNEITGIKEFSNESIAIKLSTRMVDKS